MWESWKSVPWYQKHSIFNSSWYKIIDFDMTLSYTLLYIGHIFPSLSFFIPFSPSRLSFFSQHIVLLMSCLEFKSEITQVRFCLSFHSYSLFCSISPSLPASSSPHTLSVFLGHIHTNICILIWYLYVSCIICLSASGLFCLTQCFLVPSTFWKLYNFVLCCWVVHDLNKYHISMNDADRWLLGRDNKKISQSIEIIVA